MTTELEKQFCECCGDKLSKEERDAKEGTCFPCQKGNCPERGGGSQ